MSEIPSDIGVHSAVPDAAAPKRGWLARLTGTRQPAAKAPSKGNMIFVAVLGAVVVAGSWGALVYGERQAQTQYQTLAESRRVVQEASADRVHAIQDGKLVHVVGAAAIGGTLADPDFASVRVPHAAVLRRRVETYSWHESSHSRKDGDTEYSYSRDWSEEVQDSSRFHQRYGHDNPAPVFASAEMLAPDVRVGARHVSEAVLQGLAAEEVVVPAATRGRVVDQRLYLGADPESPSVGDQRIGWTTVRPAALSVMAGQQGAELVPYRASTGRDVAMIVPGEASSADLVREAQERSEREAWWWRGWTSLGVAVGFLFLLLPSAVMGRRFPLLGSLAGLGTSFSGFFVLLLLSVALAVVVGAPVVGAGLAVSEQARSAGFLLVPLAVAAVLIRRNRRRAV